jgi:hypothetical protein
MDPDPTPPPPPPPCPEPNYGRCIKNAIGRLPKPERDKVNLLLLDGLPHAEIPARLGDLGKNITTDSVDRWAAGGFKLWLAKFNDLQESRAEQETAMDLACTDGGSRIHEATLQLAATRLTGLLRQLDCSDFKELLREDPAKLIPLLNSLATISNAELKCERHRIDLQERASKTAGDCSETKPAGLRPETRKHMENEMNLM